MKDALTIKLFTLLGLSYAWVVGGSSFKQNEYEYVIL